MKNAQEQIRGKLRSLCVEQGGAVIDGKSGDPHGKHEAPRQGHGHGSASNSGVSGKETPGGGGSSHGY